LQNDRAAESFVAETATSTQGSPGTVRTSAQIGENLCRKAQDRLAGTPLEDRQTDLLKIARPDLVVLLRRTGGVRGLWRLLVDESCGSTARRVRSGVMLG
jgi:hypothetical protein